jgi:hypothetical protein
MYNFIRLSRLLTATLIIALGLAGCASQREDTGKPDWISGNSKAYPAEQFLIGRGEAEIAAVARDRARADLAKIFEVSINEQSRDITEYSRTGSGGKTLANLEASATRQISTSTDQTLSHIEIGGVWQDPKTGRHYALAILDRLKAEAQLRNAIQQLDSVTATAIAAAREENQLLRKLGHAERAVQTQLQRRALQRQLQVVNPGGNGVPERYSLAQLLQDRNGLADRIRISSVVTQDTSGQLPSLIAGALAEAGFRQVNDAANYQLESSLATSAFKDNNWHWVHGSLSITLISLQDRSVQGTYRWEIKQAGSQPSLARQRALDSLATRLDNELRQVIISFALPQQ